MQRRRFRYTKDNGDVSEREVIIVSPPRENYLVYDVSKLTEKQVMQLVHVLKRGEEERDIFIKQFENNTGIKTASLWRSFKPKGIEWIEE